MVRALTLHFISLLWQRSAPTFFLNCTKNTELTSAHFARTVTFALIKIHVVPNRMRPVGDRHQKSEAASDRDRAT
jgi:hypothetical protein